MSKIYDTLGKKYKAKGIDGVQDFGVCMHSFCVFKNFYSCLIGWEAMGSSMAEWLGRRTCYPEVAGSSSALTTKLFLDPGSTPRSCLQIVNWSPPSRQLGFLSLLCLFEIIISLSQFKWCA